MFLFLDFYDNFSSLIWIVQNNIQSKDKNNWYLLWPLCLHHVGSFAGLPTLHVAATRIVTHFSDNDKGLKVYRQDTKKSRYCNLLMKQTFFEVKSISLPDMSPFWYYWPCWRNFRRSLSTVHLQGIALDLRM